MTRAVLYLRSSKDRSDVSIDAQRRALHELALGRGLVVVDEYADAVESGKDEDRPAFQRLIADLKAPARAWQHVLVLDTSRIARRRLIAMMFESDCAKRGVHLVYKSLPEADPATDMVLRSVLQAFDEYHSLVSRAKGLAGMAENVRQGWRAGGRAPRGSRLEYHATGAVREGVPVTKTRLVVDDELAPQVRQYLELRARGMARGVAIARLQLPWPASSTHSMDWQALTYAGHTVWGMHAERAGGGTMAGQKRRPRAQWQVQRNTHPALISDADAEAILRQQEQALQGRRNRASPLLLTGLLVDGQGRPWHSDGCGFYRVAKGPKIGAQRVERAVVARLHQDLADDATIARIQAAMAEISREGQPVDGRTIAGLERRASALASQVARTVDLASRLADPSPVLRRLEDLEHQRAGVLAQAEQLRQQQQRRDRAGAIDAGQVRQLLASLFEEIQRTAGDDELRAEARQVLGEVLERIELDPGSPVARLHYAVATGVSVASPRASEQSPVVRWISELPIAWRRAA